MRARLWHTSLLRPECCPNLKSPPRAAEEYCPQNLENPFEYLTEDSAVFDTEHKTEKRRWQRL